MRSSMHLNVVLCNWLACSAALSGEAQPGGKPAAEVDEDEDLWCFWYAAYDDEDPVDWWCLWCALFATW